MKHCTVILVLSLVATGFAQETSSPVLTLKGLRLFGPTQADLPVTLLREDPITIEFDIQAGAPPRLELRFHHCDRNWQLTETSFVNDEFLNKTRMEPPFEVSPSGVQGYAYQYSFRIPGSPLFDGFMFSGNYILEIRDVDNDRLLGSARFFVAEQLLQPDIRVINRRDPDAIAPRNQVHAVKVAFSVPTADSADALPYFSHDFSTVDIYKNRELSRPWRIGVDDNDPNTFVEGLATQQLEFRIENIVPGNEYRTIDLENLNFYPQHMALRPKLGADLSRFPWQRASDRDGASSVMRGTRFAEYLDFQFELLWDTVSDSVFVVGDFNGWDPSGGGPMEYKDGRYTWKTSIRRGRYDYQYVVGGDWVVLEGNDWRTVNRYTALVYYRDQRFGGFDRIVGVARTRSSGKMSAGE